MYRKTLTTILTLLLLFAFGLSACAPAATPEPQPAPVEPAKTEAPAEAAPKETVQLRMLAEQFDIELKALATLIEEFKKIDGGKWSYVDVEIEAVPYEQLFPKIEASVAAGQTWDILQADGPDMKHYAHYGTLLDLTDYFTEEEMKLWFPQSVDEGSYKGRFYGPPMMQSCSLLMYNKELTDAAGVTPPDKLADSWTMEEALDIWKKTTVDSNGDGTPETYGLQVAGANWPGDYQTNAFKRSMGEKGSPTYAGISEDGLKFVGYFDTPEAIEGMQFYQDLFQESKVTPLEMVMPLFENKLAAFMFTPDNRVGIVQDMHGDDFQWGVTGHPYFKSMICQTGSWHYGISPKTEHLEEALAFVKFVSSDQGAKIQYSINRQLPANVNIFSELPEYVEGGAQFMWLEAMQTMGQPRVQTPCYTEYNQLFGEMGLNIQKGADVESEMKAAAELMEGVCAKYAE